LTIRASDSLIFGALMRLANQLRNFSSAATQGDWIRFGRSMAARENYCTASSACRTGSYCAGVALSELYPDAVTKL
jgi:hypothetical protein